MGRGVHQLPARLRARRADVHDVPGQSGREVRLRARSARRSAVVKWVKRGLLFDPRQHALPNRCTEFAQSPQALVFGDFVRIYFSTREWEEGGQYLSHISFVDVDKELRRVLRTASAPVIALGGLGCFDEHGIFPMNVVRHGGRVYAYTCGWSRRVSV